tara:strand:- start:8054 stop:8779 length:726 start_codon:yes stop_codon:yes gene_type:complete
MFWIKEHIKRYEFISKYCYGNVLDCKFNNFSSFHSAHILLENNCKEISTYYKKSNEIVKRTKKNNTIYFKNNNKLESNYDCIISFEINFDEMNFDETIQKYSELLSENGKLFISMINKDKTSAELLSGEKIKNIIIEKEEFLINLRKYFKKIELFSHMILDEKKPSKINNKLNIIRNVGAKVLSAVDKNRSFYIDHLQNRMKKIDETKNTSIEIAELDYVPIQNINEHNPYYFLAICKKNN